MKIKIKCKFCNKNFERYKNKLNDSNFCSYDCFQQDRVSKTENQDYFSIIDISDKAYWMGFLLADGNLTQPHRKQKSINLELSSIDMDHVCKFAKIFDRKINCYERKNRKTGKICYSTKCSITSEKLWNSLILKGILPNKSSLANTEIFNHIPECFIKDFIRGIFDGDGGVFQGTIPSSASIQILGSEEFLKTLKEKLIPIGMGDTKISKRKNANVFLLQWAGKLQVKRFYNYIYENATLYLDRKKQKFETILNLDACVL